MNKAVALHIFNTAKEGMTTSQLMSVSGLGYLEIQEAFRLKFILVSETAPHKVIGKDHEAMQRAYTR